MMTTMLTTLGVLMSMAFSSKSRLWSTAIIWTSILMPLAVINVHLTPKSKMSWSLLADSMTTPLIYLSVWLTPLAMLASVSHLSKESFYNQKMFLMLIVIILVFLYMTFLAKKLMVLFLGFEGTLIPTLFLITRWGSQQERMEAGTFFVFYTLVTSLPLFIGLVTMYINNTSLSITQLSLFLTGKMKTILAISCIMAFLVKVPMFAMHLWLPKAHVEAPVAGSMILAAVLLKMGGYGFSRLSMLFFMPLKTHINKMLIPFCIWGGVLTSIICLSQTDLKALMAYSSVSHMSFMMAGMGVLSSWAMAGGLMVMMAHGIVSSALFCLAKTLYERSSTRTMIINRSTKLMYALTPAMWLLLACAKMGIPPLPKSMGEVLVMSSMVSKNVVKFMPTVLGVMTTGVFSLFMFLAMNSGNFQKWTNINKKMTEREKNTLAAHALPLVMLVLAPNIMTPWLI